MDEALAGIVGFLVAVYILVHVIAYAAVIILGGFAVYALFAYVIIPGARWLGRVIAKAADDLQLWYREVTWARRVRRTQHQTLAAMDELRREHLNRVRMIAEEVDRYQVAMAREAHRTRTTRRTAAVRPVVGVAVRHR